MAYILGKNFADLWIITLKEAKFGIKRSLLLGEGVGGDTFFILTPPI